MFTFKQFLVEAGISFPGTSSYGYWVTETGKFIPVEPYGHMYAAAPVFFPLKNPNNLDDTVVYNKAFSKGWIRIVHTSRHPEEVNVSFEQQHVSQKALRTILFAVVKERNYHNNFALFVNDGNKESRADAHTAPALLRKYVKE